MVLGGRTKGCARDDVSGALPLTGDSLRLGMPAKSYNYYLCKLPMTSNFLYIYVYIINHYCRIPALSLFLSLVFWFDRLFFSSSFV